MKFIKALFAVLALSFSLNALALNDDQYMEFTGAVTEGNLKVVKKYVEADPKILEEKFFAWEPLQMAASHNQLEIVKYLIKKGADLNYAHPVEKTTALHLAAYAGFKDVVKALADGGADINKKMKGGMSIVHVVRENNSPEMADYLLSLGVKDDGCTKDCF
jgi:uncharacterized protein